MIKKIFKTKLICLLFLWQTSLFSAENHDAKPPENQQKKDSTKKDDKQTNTTKILPLPRHILFPTIKYARAQDTEGEFTLDYSKHKVWIFILMSTWNTKCAEISKILNINNKKFIENDIGLLSLYSQTVEEDVEKWREKNKPIYDNFFAAQNFLDELNNPKVPSIWLIGDKGEILMEQELPTIHQIDLIIKKALILTRY